MRYPGYDYAQPGGVHLTICTENRQHLFGMPRDGQVLHSAAGLAALELWDVLPARFPTVMADMYVVMPDHLHVMLFTGIDPERPETRETVGAVVRWFKTAMHRRYRDGVNRRGWPPYEGKLWQRDYYDHIIRNDRDLATIQAYIEANPLRWWERYGDDP
jgi:REP element-mobilizing transposase RayT